MIVTKNIFLIGCCLFLVACTPANNNQKTTNDVTVTAISEIVQITNTLVPTETSTLTPSTTPTMSPSPTSTPSATPTQTATPSPTPTATYTPSTTPTPTNTPTATAVPATNTPLPTPTPALPEVPLYPQTPIQPWDINAFKVAVATTEESTHNFHDYFGGVAKGEQGNCYRFFEFYGTWERQPAFTDVPSDWQVYHHEYRAILHELRMAIAPITEVCANNGGTVSDEADQRILASLENLRSRLEQLQTAVQSR